MTAITPYVPDPALPRAFLVDVDGTVALRGDRSPYDESRVGEDVPNWPVVMVVRALAEFGLQPIYLSGRSDACARVTALWLMYHIGTPPNVEMLILMREAGDNRSDVEVKLELFDKHIRESYCVVLSLDDRNRVVKLWRDLGLTCLQVAEGDF
jgi:hypothetical protein